MTGQREGRAAAIDVPTLVFAAAGIAATAVLPFVRVRPNRIAEGTAQLLLGISPAAAACLLLLWGAAGVAALLGRAGQARARVVMALSIAAPVAAVVAAGLVTTAAAGASTIARASLAAGFWTTTVLGYASFLSSSTRAGLGRDLLRRVLGFSVPVVIGALLFSGFLDAVSVVREWAVQKTVFLAETVNHLVLSGMAVLAGGVVGLLVGIVSRRRAGFRQASFFVLNIVQTIPSLALFGLLILPLAALSRRFPILHEWGISGIGRAPAVIALSFYAMLPIARNTLTALAGIPPAARDAGRGMGMTRGQLLGRVEIPLALPVILAGVRTATVQSIGNVVVTALIGAGGLGVFIFQGLGQFAADLILLGTLPVIAMAVAADQLLGGLVRLVTPRPLRGVEA
ncbi:MAG TPA: ABC transporter permease [Spirochaetia bacterium]|nr:ABC transporter permease [Spirochaetia bacterium]